MTGDINRLNTAGHFSALTVKLYPKCTSAMLSHFTYHKHTIMFFFIVPFCVVTELHARARDAAVVVNRCLSLINRCLQPVTVGIIVMFMSLMEYVEHVWCPSQRVFFSVHQSLQKTCDLIRTGRLLLCVQFQMPEKVEQMNSMSSNRMKHAEVWECFWTEYNQRKLLIKDTNHINNLQPNNLLFRVHGWHLGRRESFIISGLVRVLLCLPKQQQQKMLCCNLFEGWFLLFLFLINYCPGFEL